MAATQGTASTMYEDFEPAYELVQEQDCDTILLHLPAYKKEHLRVRLSSTILKISGSRPLGHNKWERFDKEFPVSANCDTKNITARIESGILYVRQPKLITPAAGDKEPQKPADEPQAQEKHLQEQAAAKEAASQEYAAKMARAKSEERIPDGSTDVKNAGETIQEKKTSLPDKSPDEESSSTSSSSSSSSDEEDKKKKTTHQPKSTDSINATKNDNKGTPGKTRPTSYGGITAGGNAAKLKMARRMTNVALVVLGALGAIYLALCARNFITFFRRS